MRRRNGRGEVVHISSLFDAYKKRLRPPQQSVIRVFIEVVDEVMGYNIPPDKVEYNVRNKVLSVRVPGMLRNELKLREGELLSHLKGRLGEVSAPERIV